MMTAQRKRGLLLLALLLAAFAWNRLTGITVLGLLGWID